MLAKNLPAGVESEELQRMFEKFGDCTKVLMPTEGGVSALVIMGNPVDAKKAFRALAYSRFRSQPLYLEWAPYDVMGATAPPAEDKTAEVADKPKLSKREMTYEEKRKERKNRQQGITEEEKDDGEVIEEEEKPKEVEAEDKKKSSKKQSEKEIESGSTLFVKNLAFDTTDGSLEFLFRYGIKSILSTCEILRLLCHLVSTRQFFDKLKKKVCAFNGGVGP